jgi:hypothetical protein
MKKYCVLPFVCGAMVMFAFTTLGRIQSFIPYPGQSLES